MGALSSTEEEGITGDEREITQNVDKRPPGEPAKAIEGQKKQDDLSERKDTNTRSLDTMAEHPLEKLKVSAEELSEKADATCREITTDLLLKKVKIDRSSVTELDQKLFYYAKCQVAQEKRKLNDCELCIDFKNQSDVTIKTNDNPSKRIYVGYDQKCEPVYIWERGSDFSKEVGLQLQLRMKTEVQSELEEATGNGIKTLFANLVKVILPEILDLLPLPKFIKNFLVG